MDTGSRNARQIHPRGDAAPAACAAYSGAMARIILFVVAAAVVLVLLWVLFWNFLHLLILGFGLLLVVLLGFGLFRVGRWSASKRKRA